MEQRQYEIVKFVDNGFELEVNVSPKENTVWLSQAEMSLLFDRDISVISRHIKNVLSEGECDEKSNLHFLQIPFSDKPMVLYSLDIIISVGYRVKSQRGVVFRRWATSVLRQYLLRGYAIDSTRVLVSQENYLDLVNVVNRIDSTQSELITRVEKLENKYPELAGKVFYDGQIWDAVSCLENLISKAGKSIVLIDDYVDNLTLDILSRKQDRVSVILVTDDRNTRLSEKETRSFNAQFGGLEVRYSRIFHDRFLILDDKELFYCGTSLKDAGRKVFAIGRIRDNESLQGILSRIK